MFQRLAKHQRQGDDQERHGPCPTDLTYFHGDDKAEFPRGYLITGQLKGILKKSLC